MKLLNKCASKILESLLSVANWGLLPLTMESISILLCGLVGLIDFLL